jgi:cytochrome c-type biogenesis protein CcsB
MTRTMHFKPRWSCMLGAMLLLLLALARPAAAVTMDQAMPGAHPALPEGHPSVSGAAATQARPAEDSLPRQDRTEFRRAVKLDSLRLLAVQHNDQVKILDSWARQCLSKIRNRQSIDGQDPLYTALDMAFRPEVWMNRPIIYVQAIPIRQKLASLAPSEQAGTDIVQKGLVSPSFLLAPETRQLLESIQLETRLAPAVNKVMIALQTFLTMPDTLLLVPPPAGEEGSMWRHPVDLQAKMDLPAERLHELGLDPKTIAGYTKEQGLRIFLAVQQFASGWRGNDVATANLGLQTLAEQLPKVNAAEYPSERKRDAELWYNRTSSGTLIDVFLYFIAMVLFLLTAVGVSRKLWFVAMPLFTVAVLTHLAAMGIRWWLAGRIPIQNQFESVLGAALLGCIVGSGLELWRRNGLFGMAMSFVGFLAMTACFSAPFVFGNDLGASIGKVAGILDDYWLYIHVKIVIGSYALIAASFLLGALYLLLRLWHWICPIEPPMPAGPDSNSHWPTPAATEILQARRGLLNKFDAANVIIMNMAFWFLGIGVICGAVWADHSWGRPWGWDPKETFALVSWLVYLIIVHVRYATRARADVTAWLAILGFAIMLFNWIGVNFFLVGLHSYA